ncbi:MAG: hypothetical protein H7335_11275 [Massilia sp.]|nr:hypothetical protein [Massilia sp.]
MSQNASFDASIPVLTEVFEEAPASAPTAPHNEAAAGLEAGAIAHLDASGWAALERRLSERILQQLQDQVDVALEQRLRERIEEALDLAMAGLTDTLRHSVQQTIEQIVVRAVGEELRHLQSLAR